MALHIPAHPKVNMSAMSMTSTANAKNKNCDLSSALMAWSLRVRITIVMAKSAARITSAGRKNADRKASHWPATISSTVKGVQLNKNSNAPLCRCSSRFSLASIPRRIFSSKWLEMITPIRIGTPASSNLFRDSSQTQKTLVTSRVSHTFGDPSRFRMDSQKKGLRSSIVARGVRRSLSCRRNCSFQGTFALGAFSSQLWGTHQLATARNSHALR